MALPAHWRGTLPQDLCVVSLGAAIRALARPRVARLSQSRHAGTQDDSLHKSTKARSVTADDKGLHLDGPLVGDERLHIAEVPHHPKRTRQCTLSPDT